MTLLSDGLVLCAYCARRRHSFRSCHSASDSDIDKNTQQMSDLIGRSSDGAMKLAVAS